MCHRWTPCQSVRTIRLLCDGGSTSLLPRANKCRVDLPCEIAGRIEIKTREVVVCLAYSGFANN